MKIFLFILTTVLVVNAAATVIIITDLRKHQAVIDRQGSVLTLMLATPEIKDALNKKLTEEGQPTY